jgi:hypothetical protein
MSITPGMEGVEDASEVIASGSQDIFVARRLLAIAMPFEDPDLDQRSQPSGQDIGRNSKVPAEIVEPGNPPARFAQDEYAPLIADAIERAPDGTKSPVDCEVAQ